MMEVVIRGRDWAARGELGPIGVAEEGRDGTGIALIMPFWRNGATKGVVAETLALGLQERGTEGITPSGRNGARKPIQRLVIGRSETSTELWKATRS